MRFKTTPSAVVSQLSRRRLTVRQWTPVLAWALFFGLFDSAPVAAQSQQSGCPSPTDQSFQARLTRLFNRNCSSRVESQASGRANGGAVRDELCSAEARDTSLIALVPQSNQGATISPRPSFFFYVPYSSGQNGNLVAEFMLLNADRSYRLEQPLRVSLPEQPGIVRVDLLETHMELTVGERYNWYFSVLCEDWELSRNPFVSGWVERVAAEEGEDTWHEVLMMLSGNPEGDRLEWSSLLSLFNLAEFSDQPVESLPPIAAYD